MFLKIVSITKALFNMIKNLKNLKNSLIKDEDSLGKKILILYDSIRRI